MKLLLLAFGFAYVKNQRVKPGYHTVHTTSRRAANLIKMTNYDVIL